MRNLFLVFKYNKKKLSTLWNIDLIKLKQTLHTKIKKKLANYAYRNNRL